MVVNIFVSKSLIAFFEWLSDGKKRSYLFLVRGFYITSHIYSLPLLLTPG